MITFETECELLAKSEFINLVWVIAESNFDNKSEIWVSLNGLNGWFTTSYFAKEMLVNSPKMPILFDITDGWLVDPEIENKNAIKSNFLENTD